MNIWKLLMIAKATTKKSIRKTNARKIRAVCNGVVYPNFLK